MLLIVYQNTAACQPSVPEDDSWWWWSKLITHQSSVLSVYVCWQWLLDDFVGILYLFSPNFARFSKMWSVLRLLFAKKTRSKNQILEAREFRLWQILKSGVHVFNVSAQNSAQGKQNLSNIDVICTHWPTKPWVEIDFRELLIPVSYFYIYCMLNDDFLYTLYPVSQLHQNYAQHSELWSVPRLVVLRETGNIQLKTCANAILAVFTPFFPFFQCIGNNYIQSKI